MQACVQSTYLREKAEPTGESALSLDGQLVAKNVTMFRIGVQFRPAGFDGGAEIREIDWGGHGAVRGGEMFRKNFWGFFVEIVKFAGITSKTQHTTRHVCSTVCLHLSFFLSNR